MEDLRERSNRLNEPKLCILHRYPISEAVETNPSLYDFLSVLATRGFGVKFVSFREGKPTKRAPLPIPSNVEVISLPFTLRRSRPFDKYLKSVLFVLLAPYIARLLNRDERIIGVYCDDSLPFYGYLVKKLTNKKVVLRLGDLQTGYILSGRSVIHDVIFKLLHSFEVHTWKSVDGLATISRRFEEYVKWSGVNPDKIVTIPESVDTETFRPLEGAEIRSKFGIPQDCVLLMFHGVIEPLKGLGTLLDNVSKLDPGLQARVKLMIIGNGASLKNLEKKAFDLGLASKIIWTGWIPFTMITRFLNACDIGIPMRSGNFANNFVVTLALLQYWACAKPVLAPRMKAIADTVRNGENGETFDPQNPQEFCDKLKLLVTENASRLRQGAEGRRLVCKSFDKAVVAKELYLGVTQLLSIAK